jgi:hypothetical protein
MSTNHVIHVNKSCNVIGLFRKCVKVGEAGRVKYVIRCLAVRPKAKMHFRCWWDDTLVAGRQAPIFVAQLKFRRSWETRIIHIESQQITTNIVLRNRVKRKSCFVDF